MSTPADPVAPTSGSSTNGHGAVDPAAGVARRRPPGPSARPAAIVFGIILVLFLAGFVADDLTSAHHGVTTTHPGAAEAVPGTGGLVPEPAAEVLGPILENGEPPADVLAALVVPHGTRTVPDSGRQLGLGPYDATIEVAVPAAEQAVLTFNRTELKAGSWQTVSAGASGSGYRFIAEHPGSDGYEWELGVTLSPTTFTSPVAGMAAPSEGITPVTLRLFAISSDS